MTVSQGKSGLNRAMRLLILMAFAVPALAGCGVISGASDFINSTTKFTSAKFGVKASPRVTSSKNVPKGGGRYQVGKPYKVAGRWYTPEDNPNYDKTGAASWYGPNFHGRQTANGEIFDQFALTAAHPTLPLPSYVRVTNLENNRSIMVRVNDRGPFVADREIDLSRRAAEMLGYLNQGKTRVRVKYVGRAPLEGDDTRMLMASYNAPTQMERSEQSETRIAFAETPAPAPMSSFSGVRTAPSVRNNIVVTSQGFNVVAPVGADGLGPLFYAPPTDYDAKAALSVIDSAFKATEAMASEPSALSAWQARTDESARAISAGLGIFTNPTNAELVAETFAQIGAVSTETVNISGKPATQVMLTYLKPGVTRQDVLERGQTLGLKDIILYE